MYQISQLMSTPVANPSRSGGELTGELSPTCVFSSFHRDFLDGDSSFECCSIDPLTGSHYACRRSPRLLTNGYYIWTEDSFLCEEDGNITLNPSRPSVMYKENLVRIFRKKKRMRSSLSLFNLRASNSWLHGSIFGDIDSSSGEDIWLKGVGRLDVDPCNENGGGFDCSLSDDWESDKPITESVKASSSGHILSQPPRKSSQHPSLQAPLKASEHFRENTTDHSKTSLLREFSLQAVLLTACLIISACARWFLGGVLANVFTCALMITTAYIVKSLFLSLASHFKATTVPGLPKFDNH